MSNLSIKISWPVKEATEKTFLKNLQEFRNAGKQTPTKSIL
jgi:hypothetical protein